MAAVRARMRGILGSLVLSGVSPSEFAQRRWVGWQVPMQLSACRTES